MNQSRRRFVANASVVGVAAFAGVVGMPSPSRGLDGNPELVSADDTTELTDETDTSYAFWQHRPTDDGGFEPTAPINVVFDLEGSERTLEDVMAVLRSHGWYTNVEEYARYALDATSGRFELQHASAAQSYYGGFGRHHVRCWAFDGTVSMQAHQDTPANPRHGIVSYDRTREKIGKRYAAEGWSVSPGELRFDNAADPDHEGTVTVIRP